VPTAVRSNHRPLALALAAALVLVPAVHRAAFAQSSAGVRVGDHPDQIARAKREIIMRGAQLERREREERARAYRRLMKLKRQGQAGARVRPVVPEEEGVLPGDGAGPPVRVQLPAGVSSINAIPTNVPVNNRTGDPVNATQAEEGIAMLGSKGVCAWNEGANFGPGVDAQQAAYTSNGGATWIDIGPPPKPVGGTWASDPVVTVNEKTGTFYYCGLIDFSGVSQNGIAFAPGSFSGSVFTWGTPRTVRTGPNSAIGFDKQWMAADSSDANLYMTYTTFGAADTIIYQRSTNGGLSWDLPIIMNTDPPSYGYVQGSRPAVGPNGEVYVTWTQSGLIDVDYMKIRKSTNAGASFGSETLISSVYTNFGTGSPGFNRDHGVVFPSIAVDRSTGPHRGRVYVTWNETVDWYDDPLSTLGTQAEVENNASIATATPFTAGQALTGTIASISDLDYFSFSAIQGKTYIFYTSSIAAGLKYTMRIYCTDGVERLTYGGSTQVAGQPGYNVWTCPVSGTYYFRMGGLGTTGSGTGAYRVETGIDAPGAPDRARDARDAIVAYSDDGTLWTHFVRPNDDVALFDEYLSEVAVSCDGHVYSLWYDYRDSPAGTCGGVANIHLTRSTDGGVTWAANQKISTVATNFTTAGTNLQPNMGDYNGMTGGASVGMAWADGRMGDVDVWGAALVAAPGLVCPSGPTVNAGTTTNLSFTVQNQNVMFANDYTSTVTCDQPTWTITPVTPTLSLAPSANGNLVYSVTVPAGSPSALGNVCLTLSALNGGACGSCCVPVTANFVLGVPRGGAAFALGGAWPNPARGTAFSISFSLANGEPATLELLDLNGRRVLSREVGGFGAGSHVLPLQRESAGLAAGIYVVRLSQAGRSASSKVVLVK
jgi:hypothetical protein